jgi:hypothetical protein
MPPSSDTDRAVAVWIVGPHPLPVGLLQPILWGLEEEGIPADTQLSAVGTVAEMARLAAEGSPLNVGIAVSETERAVALQHRDLAASEPLFVLRAGELEPALLRRLGANAARLVKGNPLAVEDEAATTRPARAEPATATRPAATGEASQEDLVDEIVAMAVARLLKQGGWRPMTSNHEHVPRRNE